jgi:hypothetical protein
MICLCGEFSGKEFYCHRCDKASDGWKAIFKSETDQLKTALRNLGDATGDGDNGPRRYFSDQWYAAKDVLKKYEDVHIDTGRKDGV